MPPPSCSPPSRDQIEQLLPALAAHPDTPVAVDHGGFPDWSAAQHPVLDALAELPARVGEGERAPPARRAPTPLPRSRCSSSASAPDRVIAGTDYPQTSPDYDALWSELLAVAPVGRRRARLPGWQRRATLVLTAGSVPERHDGSVHVEYDGHVAVLTVDRPDRLNAMTNELDARLWDVFEEIFARDDVYAVLWRAEGRAFSAGRDTSQLGNRSDGESDYHYIAEGLGSDRAPHRAAAVSRWCARSRAGASEAGSSARSCATCASRPTTPSSGCPSCMHGVVPDSGGTARLFQICGPGLVSDLVLTGRVLDAEEALRHGIVSRIVRP